MARRWPAARTTSRAAASACWRAARCPSARAGDVKLALVFSETEFSEHLTLPATTVWCTPIKGAYQIGVKFAALDAQSRAYLDLFIKFLDGGDEPTTTTTRRSQP